MSAEIAGAERGGLMPARDLVTARRESPAKSFSIWAAAS